MKLKILPEFEILVVTRMVCTKRKTAASIYDDDDDDDYYQSVYAEKMYEILLEGI